MRHSAPHHATDPSSSEARASTGRVIRALAAIVEDQEVGVADRVKAAGTAMLDRLSILGAEVAAATPPSADDSSASDGPDFSDEEIAVMSRALVAHRAGVKAASQSTLRR